MVGALADWFAVTALFRYPLGIPIPHTAIIPKRKDDIGRSLGDFVQSNFLTADVIGERLAGATIAERLGHWLAQPANAERAGEAAADALGGVVEVLDDRDVQEALGTAVEKRLAPDRGGAAPRQGDRRGDRRRPPPADARRRDARPRSRSSRTTGRCCATASTRSRRGGCPRRSTTGSSRRSSPACSASSPTSRRARTTRCAAASTNGSRRWRSKLRDDPVLIAKCEAMKLEMLEHPDVQGWLHSLWGEVKTSMLDAANDPAERPAPAPRPRLRHGRPPPRRSTPNCRPRSTSGSSGSCSTSSSTTRARSPS